MIKVMLVDDHGIIRDGLQHIIESEQNMKVVAGAEDGIEALELAKKTQPDIIILDVAMPKMDGFDCARALTALLPDAKILALTVHDDIQYAFRMLEAGAHGFVSKRAVSKELLTAIRIVLSGRTYICSRISARLASRMHAKGGSVDKLSTLSTREFQVLRHLGAGHNLKETAEAMGISEKTVSTYRSRILEKLGYRTSAEVLRYALELELTR
ncbi:MAG: DNA-binding response regulator [Candidatus Abyssobacteria bacterium SURF_17]|jgi:DNA-binding NarL/FixJ family response regulator|uniref:DNA-binding response regulator n=1 Tax=Candidatus Abyssobacteria bacterium SURF_17 TaxID=2093361 RepID=A0A419F962_9BACT|nr:MAG: DNA-binding response regulator [Candidatus Abyssubacteria bacterium SURF_17]